MSSVQLWSHQRIQQLIPTKKQKKDFHEPVAGVWDLVPQCRDLCSPIGELDPYKHD